MKVYLFLTVYFPFTLGCKSQIFKVDLYTVTLEESWQGRVNLKPAQPGTMSSPLMDFKSLRLC